MRLLHLNDASSKYQVYLQHVISIGIFNLKCLVYTHHVGFVQVHVVPVNNKQLLLSHYIMAIRIVIARFGFSCYRTFTLHIKYLTVIIKIPNCSQYNSWLHLKNQKVHSKFCIVPPNNMLIQPQPTYSNMK